MSFNAVFTSISLTLFLSLNLLTEASPSPRYVVFVVGGTGLGHSRYLAQTLHAVRLQADSLECQTTLVLVDDRLGRTLLSNLKGIVMPAQVSLLAQLHDFPGRLVVVPNGFDDVRDARLAKLLAMPAGRPGAIVLGVGCPGPIELALDGQHTLVVLNTAWWLRAPALMPTSASACGAADPAAVLIMLKDILRRSQGQHVLLVGQATLARAGWSLPLLPNPSYQFLRRSLRGALEQYPGLTYISGQSRRRARYDEENSLHYVVSSAVAPAGARLAASASQLAGAAVGDGFTRLDYGASGQVRASYWVPDKDHIAGQIAAEQQWIVPGTDLTETADTMKFHLPSPSVVVKASERYGASHLKSWLQGANYRREWYQGVRVPVLDLATFQGGLTPLRTGGGFQTKSLRLRGASGEEYVLRSMDKNTDASVPDFLHHTFAAAIVQDQISASHPYAALMVPPLAEAAGVGHTNPQLVLVPDDPRLGIYRRDFAGMFALLEARDPTPPHSFTGQALAKHYSTSEVLEQLQVSGRNHVDQRALLRARLLDMVVADWDRHDDQWRWLAYPLPSGGKILRAVPRDRDQALFVNEGIIPRQASAEYLLPRLQGFGKGFRNVNSFNYQARYFDHSFLTELTRADWQALADSVQASLTDSVLVSGLRQWPDSIFRLSGASVMGKLQAHRANLVAWADQYYRFLARTVDVVGSDEPEELVVVRQDNTRTQVTIYAHSPTGRRGPVRYQRTFSTAETQEIRLYGRGGADLFSLSGRVRKGPVVRVVGGEGLDTLRDESRVANRRRKVTVYDTIRGLVAVTRGPDTKLRLGSDPTVNQYNRTAFQYPYAGPRYPWSYNVDDGLVVGVGLLLKRPGFRKVPWAATHEFGGNVALRTGSFRFTYEGLFTHVVGPFDLQLLATLEAPNYVRSFYGLGNDTQLAPDEFTSSPYYRVRFRNLAVAALLSRAIGPYGQAFGGVVFRNVRVENAEGSFLSNSTDKRLYPATLFEAKQYLGARLGYDLTGPQVHTELPQGVYWQTELLTLTPLSANTRPFTQLSTSLALYRSFNLPVHLTLATRFGGAVNFGNYEFFQAATLGGLTNLRGYGRTRFAGSQSFYNNTEVRIELGRFHTYVLPASFGVLAFHDVGHVWLPGETSSTWHRGYGPGVWLAPIPKVVIASMLGFSSEDQMLLVRLGFFF